MDGALGRLDGTARPVLLRKEGFSRKKEGLGGFRPDRALDTLERFGVADWIEAVEELLPMKGRAYRLNSAGTTGTGGACSRSKDADRGSGLLATAVAVERRSPADLVESCQSRGFDAARRVRGADGDFPVYGLMIRARRRFDSSDVGLGVSAGTSDIGEGSGGVPARRVSATLVSLGSRLNIELAFLRYLSATRSQ